MWSVQQARYAEERKGPQSRDISLRMREGESGQTFWRTAAVILEG